MPSNDIEGKTSGQETHEESADLAAKAVKISISQIVDDEDEYNEEEDPDFTLGQDHVVNNNDDDETSSDLSESELTDDDTSMYSEEESGLAGKLQVPTGKRSASQNSLDAIVRTHDRFKTFIHEQEVPRKLLHVSIGFVTLYLYTEGHETSDIVKPLAIAGLIIYGIDLLRFNSKRFNRAYCAVVGFMMREGEVKSVNGVIWYILGCLITLAYAAKDVSVMSILLLSWCDTAASTVGRQFGYLTPKIARGKSLAGSFGAFVMGMVACYFFYGYLAPQYPQLNSEFLWNAQTSYLSLNALAVLSGFIAALSEGIDIYELDDNLTIPALSGIFLDVAIKLAKKPLEEAVVKTVTSAVAETVMATASATSL
ncbi:DEKNAAC101301 [Brettanomyces naardenensis]|uniref:DEKNAAC101301 n=1 Tax=Brettanomyces naardenensis TaxID=13370 RepID=A0A448YI02_BRENA|nr:DEKNAAC101301 [Brettanomyces naardenensis]